MNTKKQAYITPTTRWVWMGLDKEVAGIPTDLTIGTPSGQSGGTVEGDVKEDNLWDEEFPSPAQGSSNDVWSKQW